VRVRLEGKNVLGGVRSSEPRSGLRFSKNAKVRYVSPKTGRLVRMSDGGGAEGWVAVVKNH
jgi:hypothetical protein